MLLNDSSTLYFTVKDKHIWLAGLTAAKKMISQRWKNAQVLSLKQWYMEFLDIAYMELSVARCNGAKEENVNMCLTILDGIKLYL